MKWSRICLLFLLSFNSHAKTPRHMIEVGSRGLGGDTSFETTDGESSSHYKRQEAFYNNFSINYAYLLAPRWQLGIFYEITNQNLKYHRKNNSDSSSDRHFSQIGAFTLYNFSDEIISAYFAGFRYGEFNNEEEFSKDFLEDERKSEFEYDDTGQTYELFLGKRFQIIGFETGGIAYSPQLGIFARKHGKDLKDQGLIYGRGIKLEIIKFDILF